MQLPRTTPRDGGSSAGTAQRLLSGVPMLTFRSSCSIAAPTVPNFGKSWALANLSNLVPLYRSEVPDRTRRLLCRDFRSAVLVLFAGLVLANPALAYAAADTTDEASAATAAVRLAQAQPQPAPSPAPAAPAPTAAVQPAAADEPIGNVATLTGAASVVRNQNTLPLKLKDDI